MLQKKQILFSFLFLIIISLTSYSQEVSPINLSDDWEVWYDRVPVSGEIRVGLMSTTKDLNINPSYFYINLPKHKEKRLCCEISSRDGRYEANLIYDIEDLKSGYYKFKLPTKHKNELKDYNSNDITILASIGDDCEKDRNYYTIASWNDVISASDTIYIFLNSEKRTSIVVDNEKLSIEDEHPCKKIEKTSSIAYNCVCGIPAKQLSEETQLHIKQRVRRLRKISYNSYPLKIKLSQIENN